MRMRMTMLVITGLVLTAPPTATAVHAQRAAPRDTIVDVLGLERWTVDMVRDSLRRIRPGISLSDAACAVLLRDSLGFADAAVQVYSYPDTVWTMLTVVEPSAADRVRYTPAPPDSLPTPPEWRHAATLARENFRALNAFQDYEFLHGATDSLFGRPADATALELRDAIADLAQAADHGMLVRVLREDRNADNRRLATLALGHFPERDDTWHALVRAVRGAGPRSFATMVLAGMARTGEYDVDWGPAEEDLRHVLAGTNLFAYTQVLSVLSYTNPESTLVHRLVRAAPDLLLANLRSRAPFRRRLVRSFLSSTTGMDFGDDDASWIAWVSDVAGG